MPILKIYKEFIEDVSDQFINFWIRYDLIRFAFPGMYFTILFYLASVSRNLSFYKRPPPSLKVYLLNLVWIFQEAGEEL